MDREIKGTVSGRAEMKHQASWCKESFQTTSEISCMHSLVASLNPGLQKHGMVDHGSDRRVQSYSVILRRCCQRMQLSCGPLVRGPGGH
jgi:hypothetical protein